MKMSLRQAVILPLTLSPLQFLPRASATSLFSPNPRHISSIYAQCPSSLYQHQYLSTSTSTMNPESSSNPSLKHYEKERSEDSATTTRLALPDGSASDKLGIGSGGSTVKLDHLGPMVVNQDGTLSRISNWEKMTEQEKQNTLRIIGKRNQKRLAALREAEKK